MKNTDRGESFMCDASFIFLLLFSFLTNFRVFAQDPTYRNHTCSGTTFSRTSTYFSNLEILLSSLSSRNASYSTVSQSTIVGEPPNRITGLFDCSEDFSPEACRNCVAFAVKDTLNWCPNERDVTLNYEECTLRYYSTIVVTAQDPTYVYHICPNTTTYSRNSTYFTNLRTLLSSLSSLNASYSTGFQNATAGQAPDTVTGLFLCRGDVSPEVCGSCVNFAVKNTFSRCPNVKEVVAYYDECTLRYSNRNILSTLSTDGGVVLWNTQNVTSNQKDQFRDLVLRTMNQAATDAANSSRKFDARKANFTALQSLYGLVQCTPDLTRQDCLRCLQQSINQLPTDKIGGRFIVHSCSTRYELYAFYKESASTTPPPQLDSAHPPPPPLSISIPSPRPGLNKFSFDTFKDLLKQGFTCVLIQIISEDTGKGGNSSVINYDS
ncbi:putative cysteine-rich receptor-like protein kinase 23 [Cardamine amara subsp. amara]|uniref:Cysteine-rich receptor-like protein kinase 23 n=1 Tax=Cardamine amara subsp. amara TaxID=228776 RepID=A0ABD1BUI6_CARAN